MNARVIVLASLAIVTLGLVALTLELNRAAPPAQAQEELTPGVSVLGEGRVTVEPDQARVTLGVDVLNASLETAQREAANSMDAVVNRLLELGVDRQDIRTVRFSVQPEYDWRNQEQRLIGYRVVNVVSVRLTDIGAIGRTIDAVVAAGAARVEGIQFEVANPTPLKEQARELAMANARDKAEQLARLGGVTLGRPIRIEESDAGGVPPVPFAAPAREALQADTPVLPGQQEVVTQVRVIYTIQ